MELNLSYSNIAMFMACPYKWKLTYVDRHYEYKQSIDKIYGQAIHSVIEQLIQLYYNNSVSYFKEHKQQIIQEYTQKLIRNLAKLTKQGQQKDSSYKTSIELLQKYLSYGKELIKELCSEMNRYFGKRDISLQGVEYKLQQKNTLWGDDVKFTGYIDLILYDKKLDLHSLYDFKTSMYGWNDRDKNDFTKRMQLHLYKYFYAQKNNLPLQKVDGTFLIFKKQLLESPYRNRRVQTYFPPQQERTINKTLKTVGEAIDKMRLIKQNKLEPQINSSEYNCKFCPYNGGQLCQKSQMNILKS